MPQTADPLVLDNLSARYPRQTRDTPALAPCSLRLEPGTLVCIQGPSGAGKSTLLKAILGLIPTTGSARLGDALVSRPVGSSRDNFSRSHRAIRSRLSWVGQASDLCNHSTALTNTCHGRLAATSLWGSLVQGPSGETLEKARFYLEKLGLGEVRHQRVRRLSGGQKQRVAIARALVQHSDWILADEPFSALDEASQQIALKALLSVRDEGRGVLMVLHDNALAHSIADRILTVDQGAVTHDMAART